MRGKWSWKRQQQVQRPGGRNKLGTSEEQQGEHKGKCYAGQLREVGTQGLRPKLKSWGFLLGPEGNHQRFFFLVL